jgi:hypothetical protein
MKTESTLNAGLGLEQVMGILAGLVIVFFLIFGLFSSYKEEQKSDDVRHAGGRNAAYEWVKDVRLDEITDDSSEHLTKRKHYKFVMWVFGDGVAEYSEDDTRMTDRGKADYGNVQNWRAANSVLFVKLSLDGTRTYYTPKDPNNPINDDPIPSDSVEHTVNVYSTEAWLVDRSTRQLIAHNTFGYFRPGGSVLDSNQIMFGKDGSPQQVWSVSAHDIARMPFSAVDSAKSWAGDLGSPKGH